MSVRYVELWTKATPGAEWHREPTIYTDAENAEIAVISAITPPRSCFDAELRCELTGRRVLAHQVAPLKE